MGLIFLTFLLYVAVFSTLSDSNDTASEIPTMFDSGVPDMQETTINSFTASQNIARTKTTTTHLSKEFDHSVLKNDITILSDLSVTPNTTQLQKSTELPLTPTKLSTNSPNGRSLKEAFLFVYGVYRLRYKCPVSMCNPDTYNTTFTGYILDVSFPLEYSCCSGCSCDDLCERRGDCCPDRIKSLFEPGRYPVGGAMGCHQNSLKDFPRFDETMSGYFISKCDVTFIDRVTISACENPKTNLLQNLVPVSDENTKEAYKNKHCAMCNYVKERNILYWDLKLACSDSSFIPNTLSNIIAQVRAQPKCNILFIPPSPRKKYQPAYCSEVTSACNVTGDWDLYDPLVEAGCAAYLSPFYDFKGTFRNIFCYLCNFPNSAYSPSCISKKEHPVFPFPSFAALLDFRPVQTRSSVMANDDSQSFNCTSGFVYDHYQVCII